MVHLASIAATDEAEQKAEAASSTEDTMFSTTVYGSKQAAQGLPSQYMPDEEMPANIAYRLIHDELALDGSPFLNLASFVTTCQWNLGVFGLLFCLPCQIWSPRRKS